MTDRDEQHGVAWSPMLRDTVVPVLQRFFAEPEHRVAVAYLFGSVARGQERKGSDIDVAVVLGTRRVVEHLDRLALLQDHLQQRLGQDVDLVALDTASPDLVHRVLTDKIVVFESDVGTRVEFEVRAHNEYFDLLPHLLEYRRRVLSRA